MPVWSRAPIVSILLPFLAGILSAILFPQQQDSTIIGAAISLFVLYLLILREAANLTFRQRWLPGIILFLSLFFCGSWAVINKKLDHRPDFFARHMTADDRLLVRLLEPVQPGEKSARVLAEVEAVIKTAAEEVTEGKIILYLYKDNKLQYGDRLLISAKKVKALRPPRNPGEFDYSRYMAMQQVYHSAYLYPKDWLAVGGYGGSAFWEKVFALKAKLLTYVGEALPDTASQAVAKALLLGYDKELPYDLRNTFAVTGTMHILSVSGLHVGIVFMVLNFLLMRLQGYRYGRWLRIGLLLSALWVYAMLTGLAPPVLRSAAMFSFVILGINFRRVTNIYNSIAVSALLLLVFDPFLIAQPGFQLSYLAVLGIVWLQPRLAVLWQPKNKAAKFLSDTIAVSLAAQLATFPICLFYFYRFPLYFLPANLLIVPLSGCILIVGIGFMLLRLSGISLLYSLAAKLLSLSIALLNRMAAFFEGLPSASLDGIYISLLQCLLIYACITLLAFALIHKRKLYLSYSLIMLLILLGVRLTGRYQSYHQSFITLHAVSKASLVSFKQGEKMYLLGDSSFISAHENIERHIYPYAYSLYTTNLKAYDYRKAVPNAQDFFYKPPFGQFGACRFLFLSRAEQLSYLEADSTLYDFILLSANVKVSVKELHDKLHFRQLFFGGDNHWRKCAAWAGECKQYRIPFADLRKDNSFVIRL